MLYYNNNKFALSSSIIFSLSMSSVLQLLRGHFKQILILNTFIFMFLMLFYATENNLKDTDTAHPLKQVETSPYCSVSIC